MVPITGNAENELFTCPADAAIGDAVYISGANTVAYADVDDSAKFAHGIVWRKVTATTCKVRFGSGIIHTSGLTAGSYYYLTGTATTGNTLSTAVSDQRIGIAVSTIKLLILGFQAYSTDATFAGDSDVSVPTEKAVRTMVEGFSRSNVEFEGVVFGTALKSNTHASTMYRLASGTQAGTNYIAMGQMLIPSHYVSGNITLNILYATNDTNNFTCDLTVSSFTTGVSQTDQDQNVLDSQSTLFDGSTSNYLLVVKTITLSNNLDAGDLMGVRLEGDGVTNNTPPLDIHDVWITF